MYLNYRQKLKLIAVSSGKMSLFSRPAIINGIASQAIFVVRITVLYAILGHRWFIVVSVFFFMNQKQKC